MTNTYTLPFKQYDWRCPTCAKSWFRSRDSRLVLSLTTAARGRVLEHRIDADGFFECCGNKFQWGTGTMPDKDYPLIYLEWEDAVTRANGWFSLEEAIKWFTGTRTVIQECGWILEETKEALFLVSRMMPEDSKNYGQFGGLHKIPTTWIRKRVELHPTEVSNIDHTA